MSRGEFGIVKLILEERWDRKGGWLTEGRSQKTSVCWFFRLSKLFSSFFSFLFFHFPLLIFSFALTLFLHFTLFLDPLLLLRLLLLLLLLHISLYNSKGSVMADISHPPMEQLQDLEYCIDSNPPWGACFLFFSFSFFFFHFFFWLTNCFNLFILTIIYFLHYRC